MIPLAMIKEKPRTPGVSSGLILRPKDKPPLPSGLILRPHQEKPPRPTGLILQGLDPPSKPSLGAGMLLKSKKFGGSTLSLCANMVENKMDSLRRSLSFRGIGVNSIPRRKSSKRMEIYFPYIRG